MTYTCSKCHSEIKHVKYCLVAECGGLIVPLPLCEKHGMMMLEQLKGAEE